MLVSLLRRQIEKQFANWGRSMRFVVVVNCVV